MRLDPRMGPVDELGREALELLDLLKSFLLPDGESGAREMRAIKTAQIGEMRATPAARPMPFTAVEVTETRHSAFRWDARFGSGRLRPLCACPSVADERESPRALGDQ